MTRPLYATLAGLVLARQNCIESGNTEWLGRHTDRLESLVKEGLPSGSGFDAGTTLDLDASTPNKLVFETAFHHMDAHGFYDGWTHHTVTVTPALHVGIAVKISGRDRNAIKDYIGEQFYAALTAPERLIADLNAYTYQMTDGETEIFAALDPAATPLVLVPFQGDRADPDALSRHVRLVKALCAAMKADSAS